MREPSYIETLKTSWQLVWEHKLLWVFGLFAGMIGPMGIVTITRNLGLIGTKHTFFPRPLILPEFYGYGSFSGVSMPVDGWLALLWLGAILFGFSIVLLFVAVVSQGALVHAIAQYETWGRRSPKLGESWQAGVAHFWRIFSVSLLSKIILGFLSLLMAFAFFNAMIDPTAFDTLTFVILFVLSAIVGIAVSFLSVYAVGYIVVEEYSFFDAIAGAWKLFLNHWLVSLEMGVLLLLLNLFFGVVLLASFFILLIPTFYLWLLALTAISQALSIVAFMIAFSLFILFSVVIVSILSAFTVTVWTHLFMKMHRTGVKSKVLHWAGFHK